jgi:hypothetical protein
MYFHSCRMLFVAVAVLLAIPGRLWAAPDDTKEKDSVLGTLDARVAQFLEGVSLGQSHSAFADLLSGSQLLKQNDALKDLVARTNDLEAKYGKYRAFEQVSAKRIGGDLVLMRYLYKCENFPVVWHFTFYRTPGVGDTGSKTGTWRVVAVRFDTDLEQL